MSDESDTQFGLVAEMITRARIEGVDVANAYTVTTIIPHAEKEPEVKTYTMPVGDLDEFFYGYHQTGEIAIDVRPADEGDDPLAAVRDAAGELNDATNEEIQAAIEEEAERLAGRSDDE